MAARLGQTGRTNGEEIDMGTSDGLSSYSGADEEMRTGQDRDKGKTDRG